MDNAHNATSIARELIRTDRLEKTYGEGSNATHALKSADLTIHEGEFAAIIGQSGSGKSTLMNMIGLLDTPTSGEIFLRDKPLSKLSKIEKSALRNQMIGFVFQFHYLLPEFTVFENALMPVRIAQRDPSEDATRRVEEILDLLGLKGLEDKNANELSGGQKQRVAIARALANRPSLILADEPTGNLDSKNTEAVYDLFREINKEFGTGFVFVTHDYTIARRADRIIEIADGALIGDRINT